MARNEPAEAGPLTGIRILDLTHFLAGPYTALTLADLGAEVLKIEDPDRPDEARTVGPYFQDSQSLYFSSLNWAKRSIGIRLSQKSGFDVFVDLVRKADVVLDNYRPGVMKKLGLDHASLSRMNETIITCSLSGFGETGPYAKRPGYDYTIQALSGVMSLTGDPDRPPGKAGISYVDHSGGLAASMAICAALVERSRKETGRHIDIALFDVQISMLSYLAAWFLNSGGATARTWDGAHPSLVPAQTFATADGFISLFVGNEPMWLRLVKAMGDPKLDRDRFASNSNRLLHRTEVLDLLAAHFVQKPTEFWTDLLVKYNVPCGRVNDLSEALEDPQVRARGLVQRTKQRSGESFAHVSGPVPMMSPGGDVRGAPRLGEDTRAVLTELGYEAIEIDRLLATGAIVAES